MNAPAIPKTLPSEEDIALARESGRALSTVLQTRAEIQQIDFHDDKGAVRAVRIPTSALRLLLEVLTEIGQGNAVSIIPIHAELTTQEAADVLNVTRNAWRPSGAVRRARTARPPELGRTGRPGCA